MNELLKTVKEFVENGNLLGLSVFLLIVLIIYSKKILEILTFYEIRKRHRINNLKEALGSTYVKDLTKTHLENEIESEYFRLATGLYLEKDYREKILSIHQGAKGELEFVHFKRALLYLPYKNSEIKIKITIGDKLYYWLNLAAGCFLMFCTIVTFLFPLSSLLDGKPITLVQFAVSMGLTIIFLFLAVFLMRQVFAFESAKKIKAYLEKSQKPNSDS